jgi:hypothetical protein
MALIIRASYSVVMWVNQPSSFLSGRSKLIFSPFLKRSGIHQPFLGRYLLQQPDKRLLAYAEAASSPVKYALFQACGHAFINSIGIAFPPPSLTSPLKIGGVGGVILAFFYFALLLRKRNKIPLYYEDSMVSYIVNLIQEVMYSALGGFLGAMGCGRTDEMTVSMVAGALGPIVATMTIISFLGLLVGMVWCVETFRDWCAGY